MGRLSEPILTYERPILPWRGLGTNNHPGAVGQPGLEPRDVQDAAGNVHLGQDHVARLRHAQAIPKHQEHKAVVAGRVVSAFGGG
jgi:hypothetical protein